jgi:ubiquinone/menaquinone biosynthesis C-methylase UbiE
VVERHEGCAQAAGPEAEVLVVDASAARAAHARRTRADAGDLDRVRCVLADALKVELDARPFDMAVASFLVDCRDAVTQTRALNRINGWIAVGALLLGAFAPEGPRTDCAWHALPA